jgi:antitoxin component of MazEF toxin-antitoxin module
MQDKYDIKTIHHNRCVVIPAEQLGMAGISKGDYVTVRTVGSEIRIQRARLCQLPMGQKCRKECVT